MKKLLAIIIVLIILFFIFKLISVLLGGPAWGAIGVILFIVYYPQLRKIFK